MTQREVGGAYRAIRQALLDAPDFQKLSERARFAFLVIKIVSGPTGLEVQYAIALAEKLANQTGMAVRAARNACEELRKAGWIERDGNVLWIKGQLDNDPHMRSADPKHRMSIQRHVAGLPRLAMVRRFVETHPAWFPQQEARENGLAWAFVEGPLEGLPKGLAEGLPKGPAKGLPKGPAATENRQPTTEKREPNTENRGPKAESEEGGGESASAPTPHAPAADFGGFDQLASRLANDLDREALNTVLDAAPNPTAWYLEMMASLDAKTGHVPLTAIELGEALRDYVGNGAQQQPSMRRFRRYLENIAGSDAKNPSAQERQGR